MPPPPLSTAPPLPPAPPLRLAPPPPPVKKPRVFKVAHDITEPDVPDVTDVPVVAVEPVVEPIIATAVETVVEPIVPAVPAPVDFDHEVEMWRGIEIPVIITKAEEKEYDDMPPLISNLNADVARPVLNPEADNYMPPLIPTTTTMPSLTQLPSYNYIGTGLNQTIWSPFMNSYNYVMPS